MGPNSSNSPLRFYSQNQDKKRMLVEAEEPVSSATKRVTWLEIAQELMIKEVVATDQLPQPDEEDHVRHQEDQPVPAESSHQTEWMLRTRLQESQKHVSNVKNRAIFLEIALKKVIWMLSSLQNFSLLTSLMLQQKLTFEHFSNHQEK